MMKFFVYLALIISFTTNVFGQDSLLTNLARQNVSYFHPEQGKFSGAAWDTLCKYAKLSPNVLIGEDHFFNEIPLFVSELTKQAPFDNFFCEIDPFSANLIERILKDPKKPDHQEIVEQCRNTTFSFFALKPEYKLLQDLAEANVNIEGMEQIIMSGDRLVCKYLAKQTQNKQARTLYQTIESRSSSAFAAFLKNPSAPMYMLTPEFEQDIEALLKLELSAEERELCSAMKMSARIYKEQSHLLRIQLMKSQLFGNHVPTLLTKRNLFKYGAVHMPKGESLAKIYDLGNIVHNITDARFNKSLHIMIVGKNGMQGSPFPGFPTHPLDPEKGDLAFLQPFFQTVNGQSWHNFNLAPIQREVEKGNIVINNKELLRTVTGYDYLVIIPTVTDAPHFSSQK
jgi:hypothetical protein